ncbi:hypothetical protein, variant [Phialophora macrospora]|nr:hypothetical protein, variant [Phialophora macrospora]
MISTAAPDSAIVLTCRAIGNAFLTCKVDTAEARSKRAATYGEALTAINVALEDPRLQILDDTLASVWLLSQYELIVSSGHATHTGNSPQKRGIDSWIVHTQGLMSLLRLRGTAQLHTPTSRGLFWLVYNTIQVRCFITGSDSPAESLSWFQGLEQNLAEEETPTYRICLYAHRASTLCAQFRHFINHGTTPTSNTAGELLAEAERFEGEMQQSWDDGEDTFAARRAADAFSYRILCCRAFFYAFRLKFQLTLLELLNKVRAETHDSHSTRAVQDQLETRVRTAQSAADEILACVPPIFSTDASPGVASRLKPTLWADGVRMLWPLRLVALWSATREDQKRAALTTLHQISDELGIRPDPSAFVRPVYVP